MAEPVDEYAVHQLEEFEPLAELTKEVLGYKVEEAVVDDRTVDFFACPHDVRARLVRRHGTRHEGAGAARQR